MEERRRVTGYGTEVADDGRSTQGKVFRLQQIESIAMGIWDEIKAKGAAFRLTEEILFAEVLREIEAGQRRDGLWAKALSESEMVEPRARALYIKLRVQSLNDEVAIFLAEEQARVQRDHAAQQQAIADQARELKQKQLDDISAKASTKNGLRVSSAQKILSVFFFYGIAYLFASQIDHHRDNQWVHLVFGILAFIPILLASLMFIGGIIDLFKSFFATDT